MLLFFRIFLSKWPMVFPVADQKSNHIGQTLGGTGDAVYGSPRSTIVRLRNKLAVKSEARCVPTVGGEETQYDSLPWWKGSTEP